MKIKNSYIFFRNPKDKSKNKFSNDRNVIVIDIPTSVTHYIKKTFNISQNSINVYPFKSVHKSVVNKNNQEFIVAFTINKVVDSTYLDVLVEGQTKYQCIKNLEYIHSEIENSGVLSEYTMIVSFDAISEYYCNKIYPKLNNLERNLRKLLFNIYVVNFGRNYYSDVDDDLQCKVKGIIQAKGKKEKKEIEYLKNFFYSFEFNDIQKLLFTSRIPKTECKEVENVLVDNPDLSKLSDEELRTAFSRLMPKSDWERFFDDKIKDIDFENMLEIIRKHRNNIAHFKFFYYRQYKECNSSINRLNKAIVTAISITEEKDFYEKNQESMNISLIRISESFKNFSERFRQTVVPLIGVTGINNLIVETFRKISEGFMESIFKGFSCSNTTHTIDESKNDIINIDDNENEVKK